MTNSLADYITGLTTNDEQATDLDPILQELDIFEDGEMMNSVFEETSSSKPEACMPTVDTEVDLTEAPLLQEPCTAMTDTEVDPLEASLLQEEQSNHTSRESAEIDSGFSSTSLRESAEIDSGFSSTSENAEETIDEPEDQEITVSQLRSHSMFSVAAEVASLRVDAIVDTAAQVTIISDSVFQKMDPSPSIIKHVILNTAARDLRMKAVIAGPVEIKLGSSVYKENVFIAPIQDEMLLGIDFIVRHNVSVLLPELLLKVGIDPSAEFIPMMFGGAFPPNPQACKVYCRERVVIPPNRVKRITGVIDQRMTSQFVFEPAAEFPVYMPRVLHDPGGHVCVVFLNHTEECMDIPSDTLLGEVTEISAVLEPSPRQTQSAFTVNQVQQEIKPDVPDHLKDLLERSSESLSEEEHQQLRQLLVEFQEVFASTDLDLGNFEAMKHGIDTGNHPPVKLKMRRTPLNFVDEEKNHLEKMERAGVIKPSISEWAAAPVLIRKRDGSVRWCIDYRGLNQLTRKDVYPLPNIEECLDTVAGHTWFSKLDANSAYWQIKVKKEDQHKTAFITRHGLYEFVRMPFGLCNAPATFSRAMNLILRGLNWDIVLAFLDDVIVLGKDFQDHLGNLRKVLQRFSEFQLKLKPKKCVLFQRKVEFLGREVGENKVFLRDEQVRTVKEWPTPTTTKHVEQFLGLVNYHRMFIKDFARVATPLYSITGKQAFRWDEEQQLAFDEIKQLLSEPPILTLPNRTDKFILDTDASDFAIGAELLQIQGGEERVIAYGSLALTAEQKRYCVTRKELLAVVRFTRQYRHYLLGRPFIIRTDHSSLTWLLNFKYPQGQIARWMEELQQYSMTIVHRPGGKHSNADALSRIPSAGGGCEDFRLGFQLQDLPCGGCRYCQRAHQNWDAFTEDVDYVIPLAQGYPKVNQLTQQECIVTHADIVGGSSEPYLECSVAAVSQDDPPSLSLDIIKKEQKKDNQLTPLREWLTSKTVPDENVIMLWSPAEKNLWINRDIFHIVGGIIYMKKDDQDILLVPRGLKEEVIKLNHDPPSAGHAGRDRTILKIKNHFFWYGMSKDIKQYVRSCPTCSRNKKGDRYGRCPMRSYHAGAPMERVHLDFIGPLPKSTNGNEHILMMVDQFTKWVECVPLPSQTAEVTAKAAIDNFFSRFGYPLQIFTDQGRNFESRLFTSVCKLLQIHKARTTPYRPSANGQVERFNRTLMDAVRCYIGKSQNQWDEYLPQIAGALRSTVNRSTGFTPNKLMLGREICQPADLVYPLPTKDTIDPEDYCHQLRTALTEAHQTARDTLKATQKIQKRDYDVKLFMREFQEGDLVYIRDTAVPKGKAKKLQPPWKGPGRIAKRLSPYLYRVELRRTISTMNHDRLKKCFDQEPPDWVTKKRDLPKKEELYCLCRGPDDRTFMIACDYCDEWFHGRCVHLTEEEGNTIDKYKCPICIANEAINR